MKKIVAGIGFELTGVLMVLSSSLIASMAMENTVMVMDTAMVMSLRIKKTALTPLLQIRILPENNRLYYFYRL